MKKKAKKKSQGGRQISCWGSVAEGKKWTRVAKKAGISRSKWLRRLAIAAAK